MSLFFTHFCPGGECAENRFDYRKTLVLQGLRHDFLHTFWPITLFCNPPNFGQRSRYKRSLLSLHGKSTGLSVWASSRSELLSRAQCCAQAGRRANARKTYGKCGQLRPKRQQTPEKIHGICGQNLPNDNKRRGNIRHLWLETVIRIRRISHLPHGGD